MDKSFNSAKDCVTEAMNARTCRVRIAGHDAIGVRVRECVAGGLSREKCDCAHAGSRVKNPLDSSNSAACTESAGAASLSRDSLPDIGHPDTIAANPRVEDASIAK